MIYQFKCNTHGIFEVKQGINQEHTAHCPECWEPAQRVYESLPLRFGKVDYNTDGSRDLNPDLPHVPTGTKFTPGWTPDK